jgi:hypothetical protein
MFKHLLLESDSLLHQATAVPSQQLELDVDRVGFMLRQSEAVDGGAMDGGEVGVVGLVAGIGGEPILLGGVGVNDADFEPGGAESALDRPVIPSGAFDDHDDVLDVVPGHRGANGGDGGLEGRAVVLDGGRFDQDSTVEVGEQGLGAGLGTIDADEGEVLRADGDDARVDDTPRLVQGMRLRLAPVLRRGLDNHGTGSPNRVESGLNFHSGVCSGDQS